MPGMHAIFVSIKLYTMKILKTILKVVAGFILLLVVVVLGVFLIDQGNVGYLKLSNHPEAENRSYLISNVNILPMTGDTVLRNKSVLIKNGVIRKIAGDIDAGDMAVVDGNNRFLLPGLTDMHVHVWDDYELGLYLSNGVTTVRNVWGQPMHLRMKEAITEDKILAPMFFTSGPKLTGPEFIGDDNQQLFSVEEARDMVVNIKDKGYDFIKTYYGLPQDYFDAILEEAEKYDLDIAAHPSNMVPYAYHFRPRIATVEHAEDIVQQPLDYQLDTLKLEGVAVAFGKSKGTSFCPTLTVFHNIYNMLENEDILDSTALDLMNPMIRKMDSKAQFDRWNGTKMEDPEVVDRIKNQQEFHLLAIKKLHQAGVNIVCGTDAGIGVTVPGASIHNELELYQEAGLSNYEVLGTATVNPSKVHGFMEGFGTIENGKMANLILVNGNPLLDLGVLEQPEMVFIKGRKLDRGTLDAFEAKATDRSNLLASFLRYAEYLIAK